MTIDDDASGSDSNWDSDTDIFYKEEIDAANEAELKLYARKELNLELDGPDSDLAWLAWEAFVAPAPEGWTEHVDKDGRVFFYSQVTNESRWSHPGDEMFRDIVDCVKSLRAQRPSPSEKQRSRVLQEHLLQMYKRAEEDIKTWTGPYTAEDGGEYFYSSALKESSWEHPHERWERELAFRNAVLHRCLLQEWPKELEPPASQDQTAADIRPLFLSSEALALQKDDSAEETGEDDKVSLCSARSFVTIRSSCSVRSARSMRSARSSRSARSTTPSPDKRRPAVGKSPRVLPRSPRTQSTGSLPPPLPPATESPVTPPALLRTQSQPLPRFGSSESDQASSPDSPPMPKHVESSPALPPALACKSSPPHRVPDPSLVAPMPKSPPCKLGEVQNDENAGSAEKRRMTWTTPSKHAASPENGPLRTRNMTEGANIEEKDSSEDKEEKVGGEIGSWLPQHAQRIIKRHMGTPDSPSNAQKVCDLQSDTPIIPQTITQDADVAGGIPADDAAAGDAAVMALITGKCAPVASAELQSLKEKMGQPLCGSPTGSLTDQPEMSPSSSIGSRAQFFNLWEADPDCKEAERVHEWLRNLGLGRYFEQLAGEGFDDMSILAHLEENQIKEILEMCPMPMLHEQQLRRGLSRLRSENADNELPQLPV